VPPAAGTAPQVLILSSVEWGAAWQRHQNFASLWARDGREVFFVENTGFRDPSLADLPRLWRKLRGMVFGKPAPKGSQPPPSGVRVVNPLVLGPRRPLFQKLNELFFVPRLAEQLKALGLRPGALTFVYLPTPTTLRLLDLTAPASVVYDCVDNFQGHPSPPPDLAETEASLLSRSDLVVVTSPTLRADKEKLHPRVVEIHQGVSERFFLKSKPDPAYKRLVYFGTLWHALDYEAVRALAEAGFSVTMIGPKKEPPPPLPGVRFLPPLPHSSLPAALEDCDALLLPYVANEYNRGVVPAKLYECLATGRPVLASPLPGLEPQRDLLVSARAPGEWVAAARSLPGEETEERRRRRLDAARAQSEEAVFERLRAAVERAAGGRPQPQAAGAADQAHASRMARGFSWIGVLYGMAKLSTLLTQVAAGRWLGPQEFGRANVVMAAVAYVQILPILGFPTAISKFVSAEPDEEEKTRLISTSLAAFAGWAALSLGVLLAARPYLAPWLGMSEGLLEEAVWFAFATALYTVGSSPLLGLTRFQKRGASELIYGCAAPLVLLGFVLSGRRDHRSLLLSLGASLCAGTLYSAWALRGRLRPPLTSRAVTPLLAYAATAALNLLATACVIAPARLMLHAHETAHEVGVFSAYFTVTVQVSLALLYMASSVIVPLASDGEGQRRTWALARPLALPLCGAAALGFFALAAGALSAFGKRYPFEPLWAALFALAAALVLAHGLLSALFAARDYRGLIVSVAGGLLAGAANIAFCSAFVPKWGITGAGLALVLGFLLGLAPYAVFAPKEAR
jgi:O-antigen/teichoic acid export membrane protein